MTPRPDHRRFATFSAVLLVLATMVAVACEDSVAVEPCTNIPENGCPLSRGVGCSDPACAAVYACRPGNVWELSQRCAAQDASALVEASTPADGEVDAAVDAPPGAYGGPGCVPLQAPDCALGLALACPASSACCACEDLFVCENGAWALWGTCAPDGGVEPAP